jgi:hypothetical protein
MPDLIECDSCGRSFTTENAVEMLAAIKGPCPSCGGSFRLAPADAASGAGAPPAAARPGQQR